MREKMSFVREKPPFTRFSGSIKKFILTSYVGKNAPIGSLLVHK